MSYISTYDLATSGQNSTNTLTAATGGVFYLPPPAPTPPAEGKKPGASFVPTYNSVRTEKEKFIEVIATVEGTSYKVRKTFASKKPKVSARNISSDKLENFISTKVVLRN